MLPCNSLGAERGRVMGFPGTVRASIIPSLPTPLSAAACRPAIPAQLATQISPAEHSRAVGRVPAAHAWPVSVGGQSLRFFDQKLSVQIDRGCNLTNPEGCWGHAGGAYLHQMRF